MAPGCVYAGIMRRSSFGATPSLTCARTERPGNLEAHGAAAPRLDDPYRAWSESARMDAQRLKKQKILGF